MNKPDLPPEIVERFRAGLARARETGLPEPTAMTLATARAGGRPSARIVLLKGMDERGFVFYTNLESAKAREIDANPRVALAFWWRELEEQVRIEGEARPVLDDEADEYFAGRPRGSQIGAWSSKQSQTLESREGLEATVREFEQRFEGRPVPRPPYWSGYRVVPDRVEFWYGRPHRLHERLCFEVKNARWTRRLLHP